MKQYLSIGIIACLLGLVAFRPWHKLNRATGIVTQADSLAADSALRKGKDSLFIEMGQAVSVVLPPTLTDSLQQEVTARKKKRDYLLEQIPLLDKENQKLQASYDKRQKKIQHQTQALVSLDEIDALLAKQNGRTSPTHKKEGISDVAGEVNARKSAKVSDSLNP